MYETYMKLMMLVCLLLAIVATAVLAFDLWVPSKPINPMAVLALYIAALAYLRTCK
jgi:dimeric dUTPase (all-alpha-NTP-PPase superfamily)